MAIRKKLTRHEMILEYAKNLDSQEFFSTQPNFGGFDRDLDLYFNIAMAKRRGLSVDQAIDMDGNI
jgi:hypothetical protein